MAAAYVTVTPALAELISSLPQDEVPIKLRCAICSKLAVNAFRTPCCEQMICENCKLALRSTCPVCEHTPMSADDCKPNKALRMTTKAFLKTAEKKRDSSQAKESTPMTPVEARPTSTPTISDDKPAVEDTNAEVATATATQETQKEGEQPPQADGPPAEQNAALDTTETGAEHTSATEVENEPSGEQVSGEAENPEDNQTEEQNEVNEEKGDAEAAPEEADGAEDNKDNSQQNSSFPNGLGFGGGMNGSFPNMNFGGDFNQMQMMMAMQNGMAPNFGAFPMMGMPGMGMDPSMMNMYQMSNGFGPGMDMSMMNGGMGGFNGSMGADGNWNGPQSWNNGQNNYNHPNASGMGNGDYGDFNSAYQAGYNQGNFGPHNQFNANRGRGFYRGGRGFRGRGNFNNFGRGGFGHGQQGNFQGQNYMNQQDGSNMMDKDPNGPQPLPNVSSGEGEGDKSVDEFGRTIRPEASQDGVQDADKTESVNENGDGNTKSEASGAGPDNAAGPGQSYDADKAASGGGSVGGGDPTFALNGNFVPADPSMRPGSGPPFGVNHARGGNFGVMPPPAAPVPDVPLNAPKGPKAMRQGLPNTSLLNLRARGYQIPGGENFKRVQSPSTPANGLATPVDDEREHHRSRSSSPRKGDPEHHRERSASRSRGSRDQEQDRSRHRDRHGKDRDRSESAAPERSRSGERRDRKRKSRRDHSASEGERDYDRERRHRHRSSKKYLDEEEEPKSRSSRDEKYGDRSRSASPAGSRKASHRSSRKERDSEKRRDRDRDREKDRDRERDYTDDDRDYKRKSSHRSSHRDRDRDRDHDRSDRSDRDRDREKDKDRERRRERDRERDKEREKRHSKRSTAEPPTPTEPAEDVKPFNPPTGPRGSISKNFSIFNAPKGFEIKGAFAKNSTSTPSPSSAKQPPSGPAADRDRDRDKGRDSRRSSSASASKPSGLDPHAAERERRNRERLLKETQRLAQFNGLKRRSAEDAGGGSDAKRSRTRRGGQVVDDDDEARLRKSEAEREGSRWG
ncbi:pre-mRNA-splicing factor 38B [Diaporthe eres]|uniref:RING-type domain-containing protein n=1 Tax=Diaporthe vaccinii TaxID=105482 RepID=A0ABR4EMR0_9PEZI|nr:pre-mRNA-splicing factor 38B [Diaporthe eres]